MWRKALILVVMLAMVLSFAGGKAGSANAAKGEKCTAGYGQFLINQGRYRDAIREFTCIIESQPTEVEGYRGRIEAELLLGRYSDAVRDYARVTALVLPVHPDAESMILDGYSARLEAAPQDIPALTGASFAHWWFFEYTAAIHVLHRLLDVQPDNPYGNLFLGSSRVLMGVNKEKGVADLERAIALAPKSPDVRYIVADAYTYGRPDPERAFAEASLALEWGLDTPRIHAILASAYIAFGDLLSAAGHIQRHIELVTTEFVTSAPLTAGSEQTLDLVPGRTYEIPVPLAAGETVSIMTSSRDFIDTILVFHAPDGSLILGSDDTSAYFAGFEWTAPDTGTYLLQVTSFESVNTGILVVTRD